MATITGPLPQYIIDQLINAKPGECIFIKESKDFDLFINSHTTQQTAHQAPPSSLPKKETLKMPPADRFSRFLKFMQMTNSAHDNEALTALRRANAMLAEQNMDWEDLLRARVKFNTEPQGIDLDRTTRSSAAVSNSNRRTDASDIEPMLELLNRTVTGSFQATIESVTEWWNSKHFLTEKQYQMIKSAYESRV